MSWSEHDNNCQVFKGFTVKHQTLDQEIPDQTSFGPTKSQIIDESAGILL